MHTYKDEPPSGGSGSPSRSYSTYITMYDIVGVHVLDGRQNLLHGHGHLPLRVRYSRVHVSAYILGRAKVVSEMENDGDERISRGGLTRGVVKHVPVQSSMTRLSRWGFFVSKVSNNFTIKG